ncbi:MAG: DUF6198 family protein [Treponematales bacterium]
MAIVVGGAGAAVKRYLSREYIVRLSLCAAGVFLIGAGVGFARFAGFGVDPFMSLSSGLYYTVFRPRGIDFGTAFLALNAVVLAAVALFDRTKIGMGTVFNMALTGYVTDLALFLLKAALPAAPPLPLRAACLLVCAALIGLGAGIYLNTNTGASPYDAAGLIIAEKLRRPRWYRWVRMGTDVLCVIAGLLLGSAPGIGTLALALLTGPLISFFRRQTLTLGKRRGIIT